MCAFSNSYKKITDKMEPFALFQLGFGDFWHIIMRYFRHPRFSGFGNWIFHLDCYPLLDDSERRCNINN